MAFWERKDESEWERYQRLQQKADRETPREQAPEAPLGERLMNRLRPEKEETPPAPPESCPWCGGEMVHGYISFGRDAAVWTPERPGRVLGTLKAKERVRLGGGFFDPPTVGWFCRACRKLAVDLPEPEDGPARWTQTETTEENEE